MKRKIFSVIGLTFILLALTLSMGCGGSSSSSSTFPASGGEGTTSGNVSGSAE